MAQIPRCTERSNALQLKKMPANRKMLQKYTKPNRRLVQHNENGENAIKAKKTNTDNKNRKAKSHAIQQSCRRQ